MAYEIKLDRPCDNRVLEEERIPEDDRMTILPNRPMNSTTNTVVRINDFRRDANQMTEILLREDVTGQFNGNPDTIYVAHAPIYNGLKIGTLATINDVFVRIKIENEDVSEQFTGVENYFVTQGKPLLPSNNFDFISEIKKEDIEIIINGTPVATTEIQDINSFSGRVELKFNPAGTDTVTVTYYFSAKIKILDAINGRIVLKELPVPGQEVYVAYFSRVRNGWRIEESKRSLFDKAQDVVFDLPKNTYRLWVEGEDVSSQFTGTEFSFVTAHSPILPLYQNYFSTIEETLNNAVSVYVNGSKVRISKLNPETGYVQLVDRPLAIDTVTVNYYYKNESVPDRIGIDYSTDKKYCEKCRGNISLADYRVDSVGNYLKIRNEDKLSQDLKKITITIKGTDHVATWYGTSFEKIIGASALPDYVRTRLSSEIIDALTKLKNTQVQQQEFQTVTPNEFLNYISNIEVVQDQYEPTYWTIKVDVVTQAGTEFTVKNAVVADDLLFKGISV